MHGLKIDIVKQIDSGKEGPESYSDAVQRALRNDGWNHCNDAEKDKEVKAIDQKEENIKAGRKRSFQASEEFQSGGRNNFKKKKFGRGNFEDNQNQKGRSGFQGGNQSNQARMIPVCPVCRKNHAGECRFKFTGNFYNCGQEGHIARNCSNHPAKPSEAMPKGRPNARVYSLDKGNVETGPSTSAAQ